MELFGDEVESAPVAVEDDDVVGAAGQAALDRGVHLAGEQQAGLLVEAGRAVAGLLPHGDAADAFQVGADEDSP